jgi:hypothetical protein
LTRQKIITTQSFAEEKEIIAVVNLYIFPSVYDAEKTMDLLKSSNYKTKIDHAPIHGGPEISQPPVFIVCDPDKEVAVPSTYDTGDKIKLINSCAIIRYIVQQIYS